MAKSKAGTNDRRRVEVELTGTFSLKEFDGYTVDESIAFLQRVKDRHKDKEVVLQVQGVAYEDYYEYALYERRLENDDEWAQRKEREAQSAAAQEAHDRAQYEALSKRFGKGG